MDRVFPLRTPEINFKVIVITLTLPLPSKGEEYGTNIFYSIIKENCSSINFKIKD
jgi:hypothetical protein